MQEQLRRESQSRYYNQMVGDRASNATKYQNTTRLMPVPAKRKDTLSAMSSRRHTLFLCILINYIQSHNPFLRTFITLRLRTWKKTTDLDSWCCGESCSVVHDAVELLKWPQDGDKVIAGSRRLVPDKHCTIWMCQANSKKRFVGFFLICFWNVPKLGQFYNVRRTRSWLAQESIDKKVKLTPTNKTVP